MIEGIICEVKQAVYGFLSSDLLFYLKLAADLKNSLFINKYDPCVANKIVNWKMMKVVWNIDEPKVSHKD